MEKEQPEALRLADELARMVTGREEWRVQNPQNGSYCRSLDTRESLSPERELRGWLEDHKRKFPDSQFAGYEVKKVRVTDALDDAAQAAATELRRLHARIAGLEASASRALAETDKVLRLADVLEKCAAADKARIAELEQVRDSLAKLVDSLNAQLAASRVPAAWSEIERLCNEMGPYSDNWDGSVWRAADKYHGIT